MTFVPWKAPRSKAVDQASSCKVRRRRGWTMAISPSRSIWGEAHAIQGLRGLAMSRAMSHLGVTIEGAGECKSWLVTMACIQFDHALNTPERVMSSQQAQKVTALQISLVVWSGLSHSGSSGHTALLASLFPLRASCVPLLSALISLRPSLFHLRSLLPPLFSLLQPPIPGRPNSRVD